MFKKTLSALAVACVMLVSAAAAGTCSGAAAGQAIWMRTA